MKQNAEKARALDASELAKQVKDTAEQMFRIKFQMGMGQTEGIKKLRELRKERARMLTVQRERELGKSVAPAAAVAKKSAAKKPAAKKTAAKKKTAKSE
jgi:large subunit ribosomal protein L29